MDHCHATPLDPHRSLMPACLYDQLPLARTADDLEALLPWNVKALSSALRFAPGSDLT